MSKVWKVIVIVILLLALCVTPILWQEHEVAALTSMIGSGNITQVYNFVAHHPQYIECDAMGGRKMTPLAFAANVGQYVICSNLIAAGANINAKDMAGLTPLDWALKMSRTNVIQLLLQYGADVTITAQDGKNALDYANDTTSSYLKKLLSDAMSRATNRIAVTN